MKVKLGQLKAHLSRFLRELGQNGEPLEVCIRERTVAYLTPVRQPQDAEREPLAARLRDAGLALAQPAREPAKPDLDAPEPAGDGRTDLVTVAEMRAARAW